MRHLRAASPRRAPDPNCPIDVTLERADVETTGDSHALECPWCGYVNHELWDKSDLSYGTGTIECTSCEGEIECDGDATLHIRGTRGAKAPRTTADRAECTTADVDEYGDDIVVPRGRCAGPTGYVDAAAAKRDEPPPPKPPRAPRPIPQWNGADAPRTWAEFTWPEWVPLKLRADIERSHDGTWVDDPRFLPHGGPRGWLAWPSHVTGACELGPLVGRSIHLKRHINGGHIEVLGRFVPTWNGMCALVFCDGTHEHAFAFGKDIRSRLVPLAPPRVTVERPDPPPQVATTAKTRARRAHGRK